MEAKEQGLYNHPDDDFRYGMGRFFKILPTRPYMHARLGYRAALTFVRNVESVQVQLENLMENLRLCRSDNVRSKDMVPGVMIRLKKDQECYNFLKWWATSAKDPQYNWGDQTLPYLDIRNANPLEPIGAFIGEFIRAVLCVPLRHKPHLSYTVALARIKVKLYFILLATY